MRLPDYYYGEDTVHIVPLSEDEKRRAVDIAAGKNRTQRRKEAAQRRKSK